MGKIKELDIEIKEDVVARLQKYIEHIERGDVSELQDGDDPLSQIYQDVRDSTPAERKEWHKYYEV